MNGKRMVIGVDIGKRHDPTAIAIAVAEQRKNTDDGREETHYSVPFLRRILPLGQPYPQQAREVLRAVGAGLDRFGSILGANLESKSVDFFMDVTGVGDGFVDLIKPSLSDELHLVPCRFCHGDKLTKGTSEYVAGKSWFANRLQILSESRQIHISPANPEGDSVAEELMNFDIEVDEASGIDRYGAMRPGTHDDMVCALGLACLTDPFHVATEMIQIPTQPMCVPYANPETTRWSF